MEKQYLWMKVSTILHFASLIGLFVGIFGFYRSLPYDGLNFDYQIVSHLLFVVSNLLFWVSTLLWLGTLIVLLYWFFRSWKEVRREKKDDSSSPITKK